MKDLQAFAVPLYCLYHWIMMSIWSIRGKPSRLRSKATPTFWCSSLPHGVGTASSGFVALLKHSQFSPLCNTSSTALLSQVWRQWEVWCADVLGLPPELLRFAPEYAAAAKQLKQTNQPIRLAKAGPRQNTSSLVLWLALWTFAECRQAAASRLISTLSTLSLAKDMPTRAKVETHANMILEGLSWLSNVDADLLDSACLAFLVFRGGCHCWTQIGRGIRCQRSGVLRSSHVFQLASAWWLVISLTWWLHMMELGWLDKRGGLLVLSFTRFTTCVDCAGYTCSRSLNEHE